MSLIPRRLYPTADQRAHTALSTHTSLSAQGGVAAARPVQAGIARGGFRYAPESPTVVAYVEYEDDTTSTDLTHQISVSADSLFDSMGDYSTYVGLQAGPSDATIVLKQPGWYQAYATASVQDATAATVVHLAINWLGYDTNITAYGIADSAGGVSVNITTPPIYYTDANPSNGQITATLYNHGDDGEYDIGRIAILKLRD